MGSEMVPLGPFRNYQAVRVEFSEVRARLIRVASWCEEAHSCTHTAREGLMKADPLIGTWRLISWENRSVEDGQVSYPLGKDATGYIMYSEDGYVFVAIMGPNRLRFAAEDLLSATKEEEARAEESYVSY